MPMPFKLLLALGFLVSVAESQTKPKVYVTKGVLTTWGRVDHDIVKHCADIVEVTHDQAEADYVVLPTGFSLLIYKGDHLVAQFRQWNDNSIAKHVCATIKGK